MSKTTFLRWNRAAVQVCVLLFALLVSGTKAQATSYLFSFTAGQLMTALQATDTAYNTSAYYAMFIQPDPLAISSYGYSYEYIPNPEDSNPWTASTITDFTSPNLYVLPCTNGLCTWADFVKPTTGGVQVIGVDAADYVTGSNLNYVNTINNYPFNWGTTYQQVTGLMPSGDGFAFVITTDLVLTPGTNYEFHVSVSGLETQATGGYKDKYINLNLDLQPQVVPEPSTGFLIGGGVLIALAVSQKVIRRRKHNRKPI